MTRGLRARVDDRDFAAIDGRTSPAARSRLTQARPSSVAVLTATVLGVVVLLCLMILRQTPPTAPPPATTTGLDKVDTENLDSAPVHSQADATDREEAAAAAKVQRQMEKALLSMTEALRECSGAKLTGFSNGALNTVFTARAIIVNGNPTFWDGASTHFMYFCNKNSDWRVVGQASMPEIQQGQCNFIAKAHGSSVLRNDGPWEEWYNNAIQTTSTAKALKAGCLPVVREVMKEGISPPDQTDVMKYLDMLPNKRARIARVDVATDFPFYMAFPDEKTDPVVGASWGMDFWNKHHYELIGPQSYILRQPSFGCRTPSGARRWVIQAGGHMGPYPMAGAMYGCKAVSIDGNKVWQSYIEASAKLSGVADRVQALHAVAGPKSGEHLSFGDFEVTRSAKPSENSVLSVAVDDLVPEGEEVAHMIIDVEGFENDVVEGMTRLIAQGKILTGQLEVWVVKDGKVRNSWSCVDAFVSGKYALYSGGHQEGDYAKPRRLADPVAHLRTLQTLEGAKTSPIYRPGSNWDEGGKLSISLDELWIVRSDLVPAWEAALPAWVTATDSALPVKES